MNKKSFIAIPLAVCAMALTSCNKGWAKITKERASEIIEKMVAPQRNTLNAVYGKLVSGDVITLDEQLAFFKQLSVNQEISIETVDTGDSNECMSTKAIIQGKADLEQRKANISVDATQHTYEGKQQTTAAISYFIDEANKKAYQLNDKTKIGYMSELSSKTEITSVLNNLSNYIASIYNGIFKADFLNESSIPLSALGYDFIYYVNEGAVNTIATQIEEVNPDTKKGYVAKYALSSNKEENFKVEMEYKNDNTDKVPMIDAIIEGQQYLKAVRSKISKDLLVNCKISSVIKDKMASGSEFTFELSGKKEDDKAVYIKINGKSSFEYTANINIDLDSYIFDIGL